MAIPGLLRSRQSGNEASAISSLRADQQRAVGVCSASCGWGFYATTLEDLSLAPAGGLPFIGPGPGASTGVVKCAYTVTMASDAPAPGGLAAVLQSGARSASGITPRRCRFRERGAREFGINTDGDDLLHRVAGPMAITDRTAAERDAHSAVDRMRRPPVIVRAEVPA